MATITFYDSPDWFSSSFPDNTGIDWANGSIIVVAAGSEDWNYCEPDAPTNANLSFSEGHFDNASGGGDCPAGIWWAKETTSARTGQTIAFNPGYNGGGFAGQCVWVIEPEAGETLDFDQATGNFTASALSRTVDADSVVCYALFDWAATENNEDPETGSGSATERVDDGDSTSYGQYIADWNGTSSGTFSFGPDTYSGIDPHQMAVVITVTGGGTPTADQEGFRWREDAGAESSPTWLGAQDTGITRAVETTTGLRVIVDTADDLPSGVPKLQYKLATDSEWEDIS